MVRVYQMQNQTNSSLCPCYLCCIVLLFFIPFIFISIAIIWPAPATMSTIIMVHFMLLGMYKQLTSLPNLIFFHSCEISSYNRATNNNTSCPAPQPSQPPPSPLSLTCTLSAVPMWEIYMFCLSQNFHVVALFPMAEMFWNLCWHVCGRFIKVILEVI